MIEMDDVIERLRNLPTSKYHVHEIVVCRMLRIKATDTVSKKSMISELIVVLRGRMAIDLEQQKNEFNICIFKHGKKEEFKTNLSASHLTVSREPRWFSFGPGQMNIKKQIAIMKAVTGEATKMDKATAEKRKNIWRAWYRNESTVEFETQDHLPTIVLQFHGEWEEAIPVDADLSKQIDPQVLSSVSKEIRCILRACNRVTMGTRSHGRETELCAPKEKSPPSKRMRSSASPSPHVAPNTGGALPSSLLLVALKKIRINELAVIEHCLWLLKEQGLPLSEVALRQSAESLGLTVDDKDLMPTSVSLLEFNVMLPYQLARAMVNVKSVRTSLLDSMVEMIGNLFLLDKNGLLLSYRQFNSYAG